ncbi:PEPxxWA-CTERM sorting domain-containing protein [Sphingomonas abaci]|jgi:hypothetical protein|uniref:Ice-binding protein C-terminal domain-containing protein n=1 Tax=Sphingomonas abaci TaxID=237611 RepID=A0A7W7EXL3_9SPHN|nr:PEPxxWA-CTERM sorting domain-containing protein [Sphingomonas abaci]MBB4617732.1 hypothetical protein [Sphingomonas abaci]
MKLFYTTLAVAAAAILPGAAQAADFKVSYEAAGAQNTTATFATKGVETFDGRATGTQSFKTDFGSKGVISGTYTNVGVNSADVFGGAGGTGNYASTFSGTGYSLDLTTTDSRGINYFGFWLSALDRGNQLTFYKNGASVFTFSAAQIANLFTDKPGYYGNPNPAKSGNTSEPYAFLNFFDTNGTFDKIVFAETPQVGGYESDNHTVGYFTGMGDATAVPEPSTWALMFCGLAMVGATMRRRKVRATVVTA